MKITDVFAIKFNSIVFVILCCNWLKYCVCDTSLTNFMARNVLSDGEQEFYINYNGITAKETSMGFR